MILGRLFVVAWDLAAEVAAELVGASDRVLDRLAGGPAVSEELATMLWKVGPGRIVPLPVEVQAPNADTLHHGCWTLHVCAVNSAVTVVPLSGFACPICDSSPAASPAGDRPAAVSDGQLPTAPAAGHPNPPHDAAEADPRISKRLNRLCQLNRLKRR